MAPNPKSSYLPPKKPPTLASPKKRSMIHKFFLTISVTILGVLALFLIFIIVSLILIHFDHRTAHNKFVVAQGKCHGDPDVVTDSYDNLFGGKHTFTLYTPADTDYSYEKEITPSRFINFGHTTVAAYYCSVQDAQNAFKDTQSILERPTD